MNHPEATTNCAFCGNDEAQVRKFIAGPGALRICGECVESGSSLLLERGMNAVPSFRIATGRSALCSFCHRRQNQIWKLIERAGHCICSECVELANLILTDKGGGPTEAANAAELTQRNRKRRVRNFSWGDYNFAVRWR
jgi:ATP-dependent protease Clp ATPase subunit